MKQTYTCFRTFFLCGILLLVLLAGCVKEQQKTEEILESEIERDYPSMLPDWRDGEYHDYYSTMDLLQEYRIKYPDLVNVFSIGESVLGKDIWCIRITNEINYEEKSACLIDGCIHGCEWEAGEACLYLAEYLLINFDTNETITCILNESEVYIIPIVNPDGRQADERFNNHGVDLNRNFDIDFGRIRGGSLPVGILGGKRIFTYRAFPKLHQWIPTFPLYLLNCGKHAFSEPESTALRDLMDEIHNHDFSFYVNCHTAIHNFATPWVAFKPPFEITNKESTLFGYVRAWVTENTEYENAEVSYKGEAYKASGSSMDWCFKTFRIPSFTFEMLSQDCDPGPGEGKHDDLVHWMKTTLPVFMYLLVNIENLREWQTPDIQPLLPEGVPPETLK